MNELVERLSTGRHPVATVRYKTPKELKECVDRKFVLVKFTGTNGGTELGYKLDTERSKTDGADFEAGTGTVTLVGELSLNYENVRCVADIDLATLTGTGNLEILDRQTVAS